MILYERIIAERIRAMADQPEQKSTYSRTTISMRQSDADWLQQQSNLIADQVGFSAGISFVIRLMVRYFIRNRISILDIHRASMNQDQE